MMGHLNSFSASGGEFEQKFSKNSNARGGGGGMLKLRFGWYITHIAVAWTLNRFILSQGK